MVSPNTGYQGTPLSHYIRNDFNGMYISIQVPSLEHWDMIYIALWR